MSDAIDEARAAVDDAVGHWHAMRLLAVEDAPKQRANAIYVAALDALIAVVERETKAAMPCVGPMPAVGYNQGQGSEWYNLTRDHEYDCGQCQFCTARAEKEMNT